jgi:hypothetical protein
MSVVAGSDETWPELGSKLEPELRFGSGVRPAQFGNGRGGDSRLEWGEHSGWNGANI